MPRLSAHANLSDFKIVIIGLLCALSFASHAFNTDRSKPFGEHTYPDTVPRNGIVKNVRPEGFVRIRKRHCNKYALRKGNGKAIAYKHTDGRELYHYTTRLTWNWTHGEVPLWEISVELAHAFKEYKVKESGLRRLQNADVLFMALTKSEPSKSNSFALIVISSSNNKITYSVFKDPAYKHPFLNSVSDAMLYNQLPTNYLGF